MIDIIVLILKIILGVCILFDSVLLFTMLPPYSFGDKRGLEYDRWVAHTYHHQLFILTGIPRKFSRHTYLW